MYVTESGIDTFVSSRQSSNAQSPMSVMPCPIATLVRLSQLRSMLFSMRSRYPFMLIAEAIMTAFVRLLQLRNPPSTLVTELGISTVVMSRQSSNASYLMRVTERGISTTVAPLSATCVSSLWSSMVNFTRDSESTSCGNGIFLTVRLFQMSPSFGKVTESFTYARQPLATFM